MATIDKGSITVTKTGDGSVFTIGFDFTDDAALNVNEGWKSVWIHAQFIYNKNMTGAEFISAANGAMALARRPSAETNLETTLKAQFGSTIIRTDPNPVEAEPQHVKIMAIDPAVIFRTDEVP